MDLKKKSLISLSVRTKASLPLEGENYKPSTEVEVVPVVGTNVSQHADYLRRYLGYSFLERLMHTGHSKYFLVGLVLQDRAAK